MSDAMTNRCCYDQLYRNSCYIEEDENRVVKCYTCGSTFTIVKREWFTGSDSQTHYLIGPVPEIVFQNKTAIDITRDKEWSDLARKCRRDALIGGATCLLIAVSCVMVGLWVASFMATACALYSIFARQWS